MTSTGTPTTVTWVLAYSFIALIVLAILWFLVKVFVRMFILVVPPNHVALITRLGRFMRIADAGWHLPMPWEAPHAYEFMWVQESDGVERVTRMSGPFVTLSGFRVDPRPCQVTTSDTVQLSINMSYVLQLKSANEAWKFVTSAGRDGPIRVFIEAAEGELRVAAHTMKSEDIARGQKPALNLTEVLDTLGLKLVSATMQSHSGSNELERARREAEVARQQLSARDAEQMKQHTMDLAAEERRSQLVAMRAKTDLDEATAREHVKAARASARLDRQTKAAQARAASRALELGVESEHMCKTLNTLATDDRAAYLDMLARVETAKTIGPNTHFVPTNGMYPFFKTTTP